MIISPFLSEGCRQASAYTDATDDDDGWQLVWSDEFETDGLPDTTKWSYNMGDGCDMPTGCGWGNNEKQYYTEKRRKNARVEDGKLIIEAHRESMHGAEYSSARLTTQGKSDWLYGKIEVLAKVPSGRGTWGAVWMLPSGEEYANGVYGGWPHSGEIDILEYVGFAKDTIYGNTHTLAFNGMHGTDQPGEFFLPTAETEFHAYAIVWHPDRLEFLVDDAVYHTYHKRAGYEVWPFDQPFYLLLNLAVGGNWGGKHGIDTTIWPQQLVVDYVRIYQQKS